MANVQKQLVLQLMRFFKTGAANTQSKPFMAMVKNLGLSTNELEKGMQTNAVGTIFKVMDAIKNARNCR